MAPKNVLAIAMPAFGHYIPALELSKKLAPYHNVTLCISSYKLPEIHQRDILPPAPIRLFGVDDKLSVNLDENIHEMKENFVAMDAMKPYYATLINNLSTPEKLSINDNDIPPISAIFVDLAFPFAIKFAHARGIPVYAYSPFSSTILAYYGNLDDNTPVISDEEFLSGAQTDPSTLALPGFMKEQALEDGRAMELATEMLFNSFEELEPKALEVFSNIPRFAHIPKKFIGPMLPTDLHLDQKKGQLEHHILDWLDTKDPQSVIYFSFGTVAVATLEQIIQVAQALTSLKRPFVWALRPFLQQHLPKEYNSSTAENFASDAPYLIVPWAPQKRVLAHKSTGVFVSHCGWNSTLEGVSYGVPILAWPMFGDQPINAKILEELGVGITLKETGIFGRMIPQEEIVEAVLTVGGWKEGADPGKYRRNMLELSVKARAANGPDGKSTKNLLSVIDPI